MTYTIEFTFDGSVELTSDDIHLRTLTSMCVSVELAFDDIHYTGHV